MARKPDPRTPYRVSWHDDKGYRYAFVQRVNEETKKRRKVLLGTLTENFVFTPNKEYLLMSIEERRKLIFPSDWDISAVKKLDIGPVDIEPMSDTSADTVECDDIKTVQEKTDEDSEQGQDEENAEVEEQIRIIRENDEVIIKRISDIEVSVVQLCYSCKIYGAIWLLEQIAAQKHLTEDLLRVFNGNWSAVKDILTLSIYAILEDRGFNRLDRWQDTHKSLSEHRFGSDFITRFTQSITEDDRMKLIQCRVNRQPAGARGSIDSTTRSGYSKVLVDLKWGHNKDREDLPCTLEVFAYSLTTHEPFYYKRMPGNTPDMTTIRTIIAELEELKYGLNDLSFTTDRGYCTKENMGLFYKHGTPFLMCAKTGQSLVLNCLLKIQFNEFGIPVNMKYDADVKLYHVQLDADDFETQLDTGEKVIVKGVKVNAYLKPHARLPELQKVADKVSKESEYVQSIQDGTTAAPPLKNLRAKLKYHYVRIDPDTDKMVFSRNEEAEKKEYAQCGFFASCMYKHQYNSIEAYHAYKERDEHEKSFFGLKDDENADMQDASSEEGQVGRGLIYFVGNILTSTVRNTWRNKLKSQFNTSYEVLDAMEPIRYSEFINGNDHMTTFNTEQIAICDAFEIEPPTECMTANEKEQWRRAHNPAPRGRKPGSKNKQKS